VQGVAPELLDGRRVQAQLVGTDVAQLQGD